MTAIAVTHVVDVVVFFHCATEIHRRQQGEHISLQQSHKQFQKVHEDGESHTHRPDSQALENKDQREQAEDDDVTGGDVGE